MKRATVSWIIGLLLLALSLAAVAYHEYLREDDDDGRLGVVVTIPPQEEMARRVGGGNVKVTVMIPEGADPHTYEPTPSQMKRVAEAELYFSVGSGVEFENAWMDRIEAQNDDMLVVDGHLGGYVLDVDGDIVEEGHDEEGGGTRADDHDHEHEGADPHVWMSLRNAAVMVENLRDGLLKVDPYNAGTYRDNAAAYNTELDALDENITTDLAPYEGERFLVYHPSFGYFAHDYGLVQMSIEDEGKQPGSTGLAAVIDQAKDNDIGVVFVSPQFDRESAETIADEIGGEVVTINSLDGDYLENIGRIAEKLADALEGGS